MLVQNPCMPTAPATATTAGPSVFPQQYSIRSFEDSSASSTTPMLNSMNSAEQFRAGGIPAAKKDFANGDDSPLEKDFANGADNLEAQQKQQQQQYLPDVLQQGKGKNIQNTVVSIPPKKPRKERQSLRMTTTDRSRRNGGAVDWPVLGIQAIQGPHHRTRYESDEDDGIEIQLCSPVARQEHWLEISESEISEV
jgi:hypothetical protein